jgi:hypothetical protein
VALARVNERLVEGLQHIRLDVAELEAGDLRRDPAGQLAAAGRGEDPVEGVGLHRAADVVSEAIQIP